MGRRRYTKEDWIKSFWSRVSKHDPLARNWHGSPCWNWTGHTGSHGYGELGGSSGFRSTTHRFSWELHRGKIPRGQCVLHHCDNTRCVNPDHLFLGSRTDNVLDAKSKGRLSQGRRHWTAKMPDRIPRGEQCKYAKLTAEKVREIRSSNDSAKEIAGRFGIAITTVYNIRAGRRWKHLP